MFPHTVLNQSSPPLTSYFSQSLPICYACASIPEKYIQNAHDKITNKKLFAHFREYKRYLFFILVRRLVGKILKKDC